MIKYKKNQGFSILEVLIAFVILVIGLFGASILIIRSSQLNMKAYELEQVALLANSFVERIRANPDYVFDYVSTTATSMTDCVGKDNKCSGSKMALNDKYNFQQQLNRLSMQPVTWSLLKTVNGVMGMDLYQLKIVWSIRRGLDQNAGKEETYVAQFLIRKRDTQTR